ncbi:MAG: hypothetical protein ACRCYY_12335 [Trueperaceae bacterium]
MNAARPEPMPHNGQQVVLPEVLKDLLSTPLDTQLANDLINRAEMGLAKYGTYLQSHNGRNSLMDAYQETLDLMMYLKQAILEAAPLQLPDVKNNLSTMYFSALLTARTLRILISNKV